MLLELFGRRHKAEVPKDAPKEPKVQKPPKPPKPEKIEVIKPEEKDEPKKPAKRSKKAFAYLAEFDEALNVKELLPVYPEDIREKTFTYLTYKVDENRDYVYDAKGRLVVEERIKNYARWFTVAQKAGNDKYFFCKKGSDVCEDPQDWYKDFHLTGSLIGHTIEVMSRLAQIKRDTQPGFSVGRHWFLLITVLLCLIAIGAVANAFVFKLGY